VQTYEITVRARSGFATPLKGDTLFGHICWQAAYDRNLFNSSIEDLLAEYERRPFIVVSSAFPKIYKGDREFYAFKKPDLPLDMIFDLTSMDKAEIIRQRKALKKRRWMIVAKTESIHSIKDLEFLDNEDLFKRAADGLPEETVREFSFNSASFIVDFSQPHNTINRLTGTTGEGMFAPYSTIQEVMFPETELAIFVGVYDPVKIDAVEEAFKRIGEFGFGRDASTGLGRFDVCDVSEVDLMKIGASSPNSCYTISPSVPQKAAFQQMFFAPFIRFGRHGDRLAKAQNPFKNPVIMADEGAVFVPNDPSIFKKPYIGTAAKGTSKVLPEAVSQGYALYIPLREEI